MATAITSIYAYARREKESCRQEGSAGWEDSPETSAGILAAHAEKIEKEIQQARSVLNQAENGEDVYSEETLNRAVAFLKTHIEWAWRSRGGKAPVPTIGIGPDGSVDLYWREAAWKLLVNVPADRAALATFYGDDYDRQRTKGSFDPEALSIPIIAWLTA
jgi:hypothetical protein